MSTDDVPSDAHVHSVATHLRAHTTLGLPVGLTGSEAAALRAHRAGPTDDRGATLAVQVPPTTPSSVHSPSALDAAVTAHLLTQWHENACMCSSFAADSDKPYAGCASRAYGPTSWSVEEVLAATHHVLNLAPADTDATGGDPIQAVIDDAWEDFEAAAGTVGAPTVDARDVQKAHDRAKVARAAAALVAPDAAADSRPRVLTEGEADNLIADLADHLHIVSTHADAGVCHGEDCDGGPDADDQRHAERALASVLADLGMRDVPAHSNPGADA